VAAVALIAVGVLALLLAILFAALVEMFRDIRQMRDALGILDRPLPVDIGSVAGTRPGSYGLPRALDSAGSAIVLFLSDRCATCHSLAAGLARPLPAGLWLVLAAKDPAAAGSFLDRFGLDGGAAQERITVDVEEEIARRIGLHTTPVGFRVENGVLTSATTIPSSRYLAAILPEPIRLEHV
jgi:hypothetical protein